MKQLRSNSNHTIAVFDADGTMHRVQADEIRMCAPTTKCVTFWVQCFSAVMVIALGTFFMIFQGASSTFFPIGSSLLSLGVGILIPSPKYENVIPKRISSSPPASPSHEPTNSDERTGTSEMVSSERD
jgi:hypothetical protein